MASDISSPPSGAAPNDVTESMRAIPFTKAQEQTILTLVLLMRVGAIASIVRVVIVVAAAVYAGDFVSASVDSLLSLAFAILILQGATAFHKVATTDVDDQRLVVDGIDKIRTLFLIKGILNLIALGIATAALFLFVIGLFVLGGLGALAS